MVDRGEPHTARALRGLYIFDDVILVRSVLVNHGEGSVRIRGKRIARRRVKPGPVYAGADRKRRDHHARLVVRYRHHSTTASTERPMVRGVEGHRDRLLAG